MQSEKTKMVLTPIDALIIKFTFQFSLSEWSLREKDKLQSPDFLDIFLNELFQYWTNSAISREKFPNYSKI